jgi:hypothetical protein
MSEEELMSLTEGAAEDYAEGEEGYVEEALRKAARPAEVEVRRTGARGGTAVAVVVRLRRGSRAGRGFPAASGGSGSRSAQRPAPAQRCAPAAAPAAGAPRGRRF